MAVCWVVHSLSLCPPYMYDCLQAWQKLTLGQVGSFTGLKPAECCHQTGEMKTGGSRTSSTLRNLGCFSWPRACLPPTPCPLITPVPG